MAAVTPTPDEVRQMIEQAVVAATGGRLESDRTQYDRHFRGVLNPTWCQPAQGIEVLEVSPSTSLLRGHLVVPIANNQGGQQQAIQTQVNAFASRLAAQVPPSATVEVLIEFLADKSTPFAVEVECVVRGIVQT